MSGCERCADIALNVFYEHVHALIIFFYLIKPFVYNVGQNIQEALFELNYRLGD